MSKAETAAEDWVRAGVDLFAKEGIHGLHVHKMSHLLEVEEEAFYFHFRDEEEFLPEVFRYWRKVKTTRVVESFNREPVWKRLEKLVDAVFADRSLHDFLFYMRHLGQKNKKIADFIAEIEEERINSTRPIFYGQGLSRKEIDLKVEVLYSFYLGWYERYKFRKFTPELREEVLEQLHSLLGLEVTQA